MNQKIPHITVCICTYKRPVLLRRLLRDLAAQETDDQFTYSVVVADNDEEGSAVSAVEEFRCMSSVPIRYCIETKRGIAPTRNRAVANADGEYIAFIDDDEFPIHKWLLLLLEACNEHKADGVLGPVKRYFDDPPPNWIQKSRFYDRKVNPTGMRVVWTEARTGNVLIKRELFIGDSAPFRDEFRVGEDQDFFRRKIEEGRTFIWSAEAEAFEVIPAGRWKRIYLIKKALLRGACAALQPSCTTSSIMKSILAVPIYAVALPFSVLFGQHRFMTLLVKLCDHLGKLFAIAGLHPIKDAYVPEQS